MVYCTMFNPFHYKDVHSALRYTIRETRPPNLGIQEPVKSPNPVASHRTYYRDCVEFKSGINYYVTDIPSLHTQKKRRNKNKKLNGILSAASSQSGLRQATPCLIFYTGQFYQSVTMMLGQFFYIFLFYYLTCPLFFYYNCIFLVERESNGAHKVVFF